MMLRPISFEKLHRIKPRSNERERERKRCKTGKGRKTVKERDAKREL